MTTTTDATNVLPLPGCRSAPLGSYLKALGMLRVVAEQVDPAAMGWWDQDRFVLGTKLDEDELVRFFVEQYAPTPIVTPWNNGSGFGEKDAKSSPAAVAAVDAIASTTTERLAPYRHVIAAAREIVASDVWRRASTMKEAKRAQVLLCRNELPDGVLSWIDAAVVLTDGDEQYPPLLGTGGNVGRLEFSKMYLEQVATVVATDPDGLETSRAWVRAALFGAEVELRPVKIGQFDPGRAGGANSGPLGDAGALANPWDYVLTMEGALLFAAGVARRMGTTGGGRASIPFTVAPTAEGFSTAAVAESAKGEVWAPLWSRPARLAEVARLLTEGRAEWNGQQARTGLDFARSATSLGVDRGIDAFVRHVFAERHGQNILAVPAGHIEVRYRAEVPLLAQLDPWISSVRRLRNRSGVIESALRTLERAQFEVAVHGEAGRLQKVLVAAAALEAAVARSSSARSEGVEPVGAGGPFSLPAHEWLERLDDGTPELRIAAVLASGHDVGRKGEDSARSISLATYLRPVERDPRARLRWGDVRVSGLGQRPIAEVLADVLALRAVDRVRSDDDVEARPDDEGDTVREVSLSSVGDEEGSVDEGQKGVHVLFDRGLHARLADVVQLFTGAIDEYRLAKLLSGLLLLRWDPVGGLRVRLSRSQSADVALVPAALAVLAPIFQGATRQGRRPLRPSERWPGMLLAGQVEPVLVEALRRYRIAKYVPVPRDARVMSAGVDGARLAAAVGVRLRRGELVRLLDHIDPEPPRSAGTADTTANLPTAEE